MDNPAMTVASKLDTPRCFWVLTARGGVLQSLRVLGKPGVEGGFAVNRFRETYSGHYRPSLRISLYNNEI